MALLPIIKQDLRMIWLTLRFFFSSLTVLDFSNNDSVNTYFVWCTRLWNVKEWNSWTTVEQSQCGKSRQKETQLWIKIVHASPNWSVLDMYPVHSNGMRIHLHLWNVLRKGKFCPFNNPFPQCIESFYHWNIKHNPLGAMECIFASKIVILPTLYIQNGSP